MCYGVVSGMYLVLLSRRRSSLPIAASRCCPSIPEYSTRGGVRLRRSRFRLAAQVSMRDGCGEAVGSSTFSRKPSRSATASRSLSANTGSYMLSLERPGDDSSVKLQCQRFESTDRRSRRNGSRRRRCPWLEAQTFAVRPISLVIGSADSESQCSGAAKNAGSGQRFGVGPVRWVDELGDVVTRPRVVKRAWQRELGGVLASSSGRQRRPSMQSVQQARG